MTASATTTRRRRPGVDSDHEHYKWWALSCTSLGMLLATINSGTLIIALPDLERALNTSILGLVWVILAYMIASTVLVLTAGRLSDLFGRKQAYVGGFVVFGLASLGAGFSPDGTTLIVWRVLQGIGGAFLFANAAAVVTDAFPREQLGLAMGTNTMVAAIGLVLGPVLGGALVAISWHWVFWFNVPFTALGSIWAALVLRELVKPERTPGYDLLGTAVFVVGLTGLVLGVSRGGISGWSDPLTLGSLIAGAILLPLFVLIESRVPAPMLDLTIFRNRMFSAATAAAFINGLSRFALMFLFVFYFQGVKGDDPIKAGIELAPLAIGMLIASPLAGVWADRHAFWVLPASRDGVRGLRPLGPRRGVAAHPRRAARPTAGAGRAGPVPDRGDHRLADGTRRRHRAPIQPRLGWRQEDERRQAAPRRGSERPAARRRRHRRLDPGPRRRTPTAGRTARQLLHHPAGVGRRRLPRTVAHLGERRSHPYYADHQTHPRRHWFPRPAPHLGGREKFRVDQQPPPLRARLRNQTRPPRSHGPPRHDHDHDQATRPNLTVFKHPLNEEQVSAISWLAIVMNTWNRIAIRSHYPVAP